VGTLWPDFTTIWREAYLGKSYFPVCFHIFVVETLRLPFKHLGKTAAKKIGARTKQPTPHPKEEALCLENPFV